MAATNSSTQPFLPKGTKESPNSGSSNDSIAEPLSNEDGSNEDFFRSMGTPQSRLQNNDSNRIQPVIPDTKPPPQTLSKTLFNLEHYVMIPLLFMLSFFVYYDRGGLSAALNSAQEQLLNDSASKSGAVASCYLFGFCLASPVFALLGSRYPPLKMSGIGMAVWCIGAFTTGCPNPSFISNFLWLAGTPYLSMYVPS